MLPISAPGKRVPTKQRQYKHTYACSGSDVENAVHILRFHGGEEELVPYNLCHDHVHEVEAILFELK